RVEDVLSPRGGKVEAVVTTGDQSQNRGFRVVGHGARQEFLAHPADISGRAGLGAQPQRIRTSEPQQCGSGDALVASRASLDPAAAVLDDDECLGLRPLGISEAPYGLVEAAFDPLQHESGSQTRIHGHQLPKICTTRPFLRISWPYW